MLRRCRSFFVAVVGLFGVWALSPAQALMIGAGQSATIDFDFSGLTSVINAATQPLTLTFQMTTSLADRFDAPSGLFQYQYLDIGSVPIINFAYNASGGLSSLGTLSLSVPTTDLTGSLRLSPLTESIDLTAVTFLVQDFNGASVVDLVSIDLPATVDAQIPEPATAFILLGGLAALARSRRRT